MREEGFKYDAGKPRCGLLMIDFPRALEAAAVVGTYGAQKYSDSNWQFVDNAEGRYLDAMYRHLLAHHQGEQLDSESQLPHLHHALWNALAVVELQQRRAL